MSSGSDSPPKTDFTGAAQGQGVANADAAKLTARLSNPNINNVYGSQTVTYGPDGTPTVNQTLNPTQQALFDKQQAISGQLADTAGTAANNVSKTLSTPFAFTGEGEVNKAQDAIMSRLQPMLDRQAEAKKTALIAGGHAVGSEGYNAQTNLLDQSQNDARQQAIIAALGYAPQLAQMDIAGRNQPLSELNALRTGSSATVPTFQNYSGAQAAPAPIFAAAQAGAQQDQNNYNAQVAQQNAMMGGVMSLGSAFLGAPSGSVGSKLFSMVG
jgi:hypothetical protein